MELWSVEEWSGVEWSGVEWSGGVVSSCHPQGGVEEWNSGDECTAIGGDNVLCELQRENNQAEMRGTGGILSWPDKGVLVSGWWLVAGVLILQRECIISG